jgi:CSLREA domain-containing protein
VQGGALNIAGRLTSTTGSVTVSSGALNLCTVGQSSATASFDMGASANLTISGGTVTFQNANGSTGGDLKIASGGTKSISGGAFQIGNASTPAGQSFKINSAIAIFNLTINGTNNPTATLLADLSIGSGSTLTVNGTLNCGTNAVTGAGNFTTGSSSTLGIGSADGINSGTSLGNIRVSGARSIDFGTSFVFNGATNQVTGNGFPSVAINKLTIDNIGGAGNSTVTGAAHIGLINGLLDVKTGTLVAGFDATDSILIEGGGALSLSGAITCSINWTNSGAFTANGFSVDFNGGPTQILTGDTTFYSLSKTSSGVTLKFAAGSTQTVTNSLTLQGGASALTLRSTLDGSQWKLIAPATQSVNKVNVKDSDAHLGQTITATNSVDSLNNLNWSFGNTISGTVFDSLGSPITGGRTIKLIQNGTVSGTTATSDVVSGVYTFSNVTLASGDRIATFIDGASEKGVTVTLSGTSSITNFDLKAGQLTVRTDNGGSPAITNTNLADADSTKDPDIPFNVTGVALTTTAGTSLLINSGSFYTPGGNISDGGHWLNNGTFTAGANTVAFNGAAAQTIGGSNPTSFATLTISPSSGVVVSLGASTTFVTTALNLNSGVFSQGETGLADSSLTTNNVTVSLGATWRNLGKGDLTLSGDVSNSGTINFNANGSSCEELATNDIAITSTGAARIWSGTGTFSMTDVFVQNQTAGTGIVPVPAVIIVNSGTDSTGTNTRWTFTNSCGGPYTWVGGANQSWIVPTNWSPVWPNAAAPTSTDILLIDGAVTPGPTITNVPAQTNSALRLIHGASFTGDVTLQASGTNTLTLNGGTPQGDLLVEAGAHLVLDTSSALTIDLSTSGTGNVNGQIILQGGAHKIISGGLAKLKFFNGSIFTTGPSFNGNPFGLTGVAGSVQFQNGSQAFFNSGSSDPFGPASPNGIVTFDFASTANFSAASAFSYDDRTYGNLVLSGSGVTFAPSASSPLKVFGDLTIGPNTTFTLPNTLGAPLTLSKNFTDNGTFNSNTQIVTFNGSSLLGGALQTVTKSVGPEVFDEVHIGKTEGSVRLGSAMTINGLLQFAGSGSAVDVLELNTNNLTLNGTIGAANANSGLKGDLAGSNLIITGSGALGTVRFVSGGEMLTSLVMNRAGSAVFGNSFSIGAAAGTPFGALGLTNGTVDMGANTLTLNPAVVVTRSSGYVIGNLAKVFGATGGFTFDIGTANGYSPVGANVTAGTFASTLTANATQTTQPNITRADKALSRYWTLTEAGDLTADLTFHYLDPTDIPATANESGFIIQKYETGFTQPGGSVDANANTATISGVTSFSDWTLADSSTSVVSLNRTGSNPTNSSTVTWQIVFADPVDGLTAGNFALVNTGLGGSPVISGVVASGTAPSTTWNISATTGTGEGTLGLDMVNDSGVTHAVTNLPFPGQVFNIDHVAPSTTSFKRQTPPTSPTSDDTLVFRATFSEDVTNVDTTDFAVTGTTATVTGVSPAGGSIYDVTVSGGDLAGLFGTVGLNFSGSLNITDLAGNALPGAEPGTDETYVVANCPTITLSPASLPNGVNGVPYSQTITASPSGSYTFTVSSGALPDGLTLTTTGLLQGTPTAPGPFNFTFTATDNNSCTGSQAYTVNINACPLEFGVNSTDDTSDANPGDGVCETVMGNSVCTLRAAIQEVNALGNVCAPLTISFDFTDPVVHTISPATPLPIVTQPVFIDGYSQSGSSPNTNTDSTDNAIILIELTGTFAGTGADGIVLSGGTSTVDGLVINRFDGAGVKVTGAGTAGYNVTGNFIGTDVTGLLAVDLSSVPFGDRVGVLVDNVQSTMIGCTTDDERNIISANIEDGVRITGANASQNLVWGNLIGTTKSGGALGNGGAGVSIIGGSDNSIGVDLDGNGRGNTIAFNTGVGVSVKSSTGAPGIGNIISQNSIHDNGGLGIDLGGDGVTANDPGDLDSLVAHPANNLQNFPVNLVVAGAADGIVYVSGELNSAATNNYRIDLYGNSACNAVSPNDFGEGQTYLGSVTPDVTTDSDGHVSFSFNFTAASFPGVSVVTATATDISTGDTSEFSQCAPVVAVAAPTISINSISQAEGNSGPTNFDFTVSLDHAYPETVTVQYQTQDNTATSPSDYAAITLTTLTFAPGETSKPVPVVVNGDDTFESAETFFVNLSNPSSNASIGTGQGVGTITNDDAMPSFAIDTVTHNEGNGAGTTNYVFTVTKTGATELGSSVQFETQDGTATVADSDYQANSGMLNFAFNEATKQITVLVNHDDKFENNEAFTVHLFGESGATIGTANGTGTITNDDAMPSFAIDSITHDEGNGAGTTSYVFTVTKTGATALSSSVQFETQDGTATVADSDYQANSGTLNFAFNEATKQFTVLVNHDDKFETNEAFKVHLSGESGATISTADGTGTITNDDSQPTISINDVTHNETNAGTVDYDFTVSLSNRSYQTITVNAATADHTALVSDLDYTAVTSTPLTFAPNMTTQHFHVLVNGDTKFETDEDFFVNLSGAVAATISDNQGLGTITNDDSQPTISINDVTHNETNAGTVDYDFTVSLSNASYQTITVNAATADDTALVGDSDYTAVTSTPLTFTPNTTTQHFHVLVNGDTKFETDEDFFVNLSGAVAATISDNQGLGTIANDDSQPTLSINNVTHNEGNAPGDIPDATNYTFTVSLSNASYQTITVDYATANDTAVSPSDYDAISTTTLTFAPGETSKPVTVTVHGDIVYELNERFFVNLSSVNSNATIADGQGDGTITNDDAPPSLSINDRNNFEGTVPTPTPTPSASPTPSITTTMTFTVTKTGSTAVPATVHFATANGGTNPATSGASCAAGSGVDYISQSGDLTFPASGPGSTSQTITIVVCKDPDFEPNETFFVDLSAATDATLGDAQGVGTIKNDDIPPNGFVVTSTNDIDDGVCSPSPGHCSLREAISAANTSLVPVAISFAIQASDPRHFYYADDGTGTPNGHVTLASVTMTGATDPIPGIDPDWPHSWWSILPTSPLPTISQQVFIEGYTQPGATVNTLATGSNAVLRIEVDGTLAGTNVTGLTLSGTGSRLRGLVINRFKRDSGAGTPAGIGLDVRGSSIVVVGNFIGTDVSGTLDLGDGGSGIVCEIGGSDTIGGTTTGVATPEVANLISGNDGDGINVISVSNMIQGNWIGTSANGTGPLGNSGSGIGFSGAGFNTVGIDVDPDTNSGEGNTIAFNTGDGVRIATSGVGNSIRGNSIFSNGSGANDLGIDLGADGVTANDGDNLGTAPIDPDSDTGPNNLQNFPIITSALVTGSTKTITGTLNSTVGDVFTIDFYVNASCDTSGNGEGKIYLGSVTTDATDATGNVSFTFHPDVSHAPLMNVLSPQFITATATSTGASFSTSEFSACSAVADGSPGAGDIQFMSATYSVGEGGGTASITVQRVGGSNGSITSTFSTSNGTAQEPGDYTAVNSFPITFAEGDTVPKTVTVSIVNDTTFEGNETVNLSLSHPRVINFAPPDGATPQDPYSAVLTITENDSPPVFTIDDVAHSEGNSGTTAYTFTVTKTGSTAVNATVDYATVNGTATAPSDFTATGATLTFLPADTTKQFTVQVNGDTLVESNEAFTVPLSTPVNATISSTNGTGTGTITNDDTDVSVAVSPAAVAEDGVANLVYTFTRNGITSGALTVNFSVGGTATFATDYTQSGAVSFGATSGTVTFGAGNSTATVTIDPTPDVLFEPNETVILTVTSGTGYNVASPSAATGTITNDDAAGGIIRFSAAAYNTTESSGLVAITVERVGDTSAAATVTYATPDDSDATTVTPCATINGSASPRCDFTTAVGTLRWAAGDGAAKTFNVLISQDNYVEGPETLTLTLSNLTGGAVFGVPSTATLTITDDTTEPAANPIDDAGNFVRQHYHDFLNREPDASGLAFWTNEITSCGSNQQCIDFKRVQVSAAFYISIEFQDTGYLVERLYKASYGDGNGISTFGGSHSLAVPIVRFSEFLPDTQAIGQGVVVGAPGWPVALENNKVAFAAEFVQRSRFTTAYANTLTPEKFVDALFANAGVVPTPADRQAAIDEFGGAGTSANSAARGRALRRVAENSTLSQQEFNRAFVLMQYFGYLRRNPNSAPDSNYTGYDFWLTKLNQFNGNFQNADMVKSFLVSGEYRNRAGQ